MFFNLQGLSLRDCRQDNKKRLTEISNWMSVLCGRHLERPHTPKCSSVHLPWLRSQKTTERYALEALKSGFARRNVRMKTHGNAQGNILIIGEWEDM